MTANQKEAEIRWVSSSGALRPSRRHPGTLASPSKSSGDLCIRLIMRGVKRSSRGGGVCSAWTPPQMPRYL